ncbi:MAG: M28 family peptidase [Treponemataceae bacterium]|nr:MAG: M28 family peptidase [Treponemataceae bacterium]
MRRMVPPATPPIAFILSLAWYICFMSALPDSFSDFTSSSCCREQFIVDFLESRGVQTSIIPLGDSRHIYARFDSIAYNPNFKIKTAIAHYDRVPQSPGSNDNSAAVWQLMEFAARLKNFPGAHNMRIFWTDGEEIGSSSALTGMGAFGIAQRLKALGITNDDVYVFDCCGRGDVAVLAKTRQALITDLTKRTQSLLSSVAGGGWVSLPVSYSDNAGFLAQGIPAVLVTLLPSDEATRYMRELQRDKTLEKAVLNNAGASDPRVKEKLPLTWRLLHSSGDDDSSLTPESFSLMRTLLDKLAAAKTVA